MDYMRFLHDFFEGLGWRVALVDGRSAVRTAYASAEGLIPCVAVLFEARPCLAFYAILPEKLTGSAREEMMRFITHANYEMLLGNFEMHPDVGDVRYKTVLDMSHWLAEMQADAVLVQKNWERVVAVNLQMMQSHWHGLVGIATGRLSAQAGIELVEGEQVTAGRNLAKVRGDE